MEQVLNQILTELKELNNRVGNLEKNQDQLAKNQEEFAKKQEEFAEGQARLEKKLDAVYDQTADLTEFRTETRQNLNTISDNIRFLLHKEMETEKEIFLLKERKASTL